MASCRECAELEEHTHLEMPDSPDQPPAPTNWWHCRACNRHLNRYRGQTDQSCECGAWYNASGQMLRDHWMDNPSYRDDDIDDMGGFELASLAEEARMS